MAADQSNGKTIGILIYPGVSMFELTGTYSLLNGMKMAKYDVLLVAEEHEMIPSDTPLKIKPHTSIHELTSPSILVVLGGGTTSLHAFANRKLREYIQSAASAADYVIGIGSGAVLLAACGLLHNRPASTHWAYAGLLEAFGARYVRQRWVEDGKFITTAGGSGGMDMVLSFLSRHAGEKNARLLQLFAEYDPAPPYGGIDWDKVNGSTALPFKPGDIQALQQAVAGEPALGEAVRRWAESTIVPA